MVQYLASFFVSLHLEQFFVFIGMVWLNKLKKLSESWQHCIRAHAVSWQSSGMPLLLYYSHYSSPHSPQHAVPLLCGGVIRCVCVSGLRSEIIARGVRVTA
jgi:hypothetical protein